MELILNLVWLVLALAAIGYCRHRWCSSEAEAEAHPIHRKWIALGCALVLLFFVISLTDDLHPELASLEDSSGSKRLRAGWARLHATGSSGRPLAHAASAIVPERRFEASTVVVDGIVAAGLLPPALVLLRPTPGRAPPSLPL